MTAAVAALALLPYLRALGAGFVSWDDPAMIVNNPLVLRPGADALTSFHMTSYQPLGWWLYAALSGLGGGARPFHAASLALHALNAALAFEVVRGLLPRTPARASAAALAVLLWAWHPVQAESVAWASQLSDLLCAACVLGALLARERARPNAALILFVLAGLCRWKALAYPVFALALDGWRGRRPARREWAALAAGALGVAAVNAAAKAGVGYAASFRPHELCAGLLVQLGKLVHPAGLAPTVLLDGDDNPLRLGLPAALAALLLLAAAVAAGARRRPALGWTAAAFAAAAAPPFLAAAGPVAAMDHHLYLPALALVPLLAEGLRRAPPAGRAAAAAVLVALAPAAWAQTGLWHDSRALWTGVLAAHPLFPAARLNLAAVDADAGRADSALLEIDEQLALFPGDALARRLREKLLARYAPDARSEAMLEDGAAALLHQSGRPDLAAVRLRRALTLSPRDPDILVDAAIAAAALGRRDEARGYLRRALRADPRYARAADALARLEDAP